MKIRAVGFPFLGHQGKTPQKEQLAAGLKERKTFMIGTNNKQSCATYLALIVNSILSAPKKIKAQSNEHYYLSVCGSSIVSFCIFFIYIKKKPTIYNYSNLLF